MKPLKLKNVCFRPAVDDKGFDIFCGEDEPIGYLCHIYPDGELELLKWLAQKQEVTKTLNNSDVKGAKKQVPDLELFGNGDLFKLLTKASSKSEGWMKSTKVMNIDNLGCVIQITTQQSDNIAEAACFVPRAQLCEKEDGYRFIVKMAEYAPKQKIACPECQGDGTVQKNVEKPGHAKDLQDVSCDLCWGSGKLLVEPFVPLSE